MADLKAEKAELDRKLQEVKDELARLERRAAKLERVQSLAEFEPGTVLMFSRSLAGSTKKYTFVAFRTWDGPEKWAVTGKPNTLQLIGLKPSGNSWDELLLAIGDAKLKVARNWRTVGEIEYFKGLVSGNFYRIRNVDGEDVAEFTDNLFALGWKNCMTRPQTIRNTPNKFLPLRDDQVPDYLRRGEVR
jgi:hypothetical protein